MIGLFVSIMITETQKKQPNICSEPIDMIKALKYSTHLVIKKYGFCFRMQKSLISFILQKLKLITSNIHISPFLIVMVHLAILLENRGKQLFCIFVMRYASYLYVLNFYCFVVHSSYGSFNNRS